MKVSASSITLREEKIYSNFIDSLPAEKTRVSYKYELKRFMDFIGVSSYVPKNNLNNNFLVINNVWNKFSRNI